MGSIADLLGDQLRAGLAQLIDPDASGSARPLPGRPKPRSRPP